MRATIRPLLGLALATLSAGAAAAAPEGFRRVLACPPGFTSLVIPSRAGEFGDIRYRVPCGFYGRVGINQYAYYGPFLPPVWRTGRPYRRHVHERQMPRHARK